MDSITSIITIDKHSPAPLYAQIKESVKAAVRTGKLGPGDKLPTEEEICSCFGVSRPVVRQAYSQLAAERIIERRRGHGSYVKAADTDDLKLYQLLNFEEEMKLLGKTPGTRLIKTEILEGSAKIRQALEMGEKEKCLMICRLRYADQIPFSLVTNYVSLSRFPGIDQFDFSKESLFRVLESHYGVKIYKACRTMEARIIDPDAASLLQVEKKTAASIVTSTDFDGQDRPAGISIEIFPGGVHRFCFTVYRE